MDATTSATAETMDRELLMTRVFRCAARSGVQSLD
jgi:hypothetical protein